MKPDGMSRDESLRETNELGAVPTRFPDQVARFVNRRLPVQENRGGLDGRDPQARIVISHGLATLPLRPFHALSQAPAISLVGIP